MANTYEQRMEKALITAINMMKNDRETKGSVAFFVGTANELKIEDAKLVARMAYQAVRGEGLNWL